MPQNVDSKQWSNYFDLPNPGLRSYFGVVRNGQPDEYRTPFYKGLTPTEVLAMWDMELKAIKKEWPSLYEFECDLGKKVGPMSVMKPLSQRMQDIESYYDLITLDREPIDLDAIVAVIKEWAIGSRLWIRGQSRTVDLMKKSTNSGSPFFTKRKEVTRKTLPCSVWQAENATCMTLRRDDWDACAVLGWRGQEGGPRAEDVKQRVVWMFPYAVNVQELQVYQPLIESAQRNNLVPAWVSMESVDARITRMFDTKRPSDDIICTDFSKFDQHFNDVCQNAAKEILSAIFCTDPSMEKWLADVFPIKYNIPLAIDWQTMVFGPHGMASGSGGTNADETLVHRALQYEAAQRAGQMLNPNSQCLGDDGVLTFPGCNVKDVMSAYTSHGLEMNQDKQYVSKHDCVYLRRWHHKDYRVGSVCVGVYSTNRALGRLMEQERFYDEGWSKEMVALRQLSILENIKYHPLRERFAEFCMKGDKYKLGIRIPGFLDNIESIAQEAIDYIPDFLGYTKTLQATNEQKKGCGIQDWWIVQFLRSRA